METYTYQAEELRHWLTGDILWVVIRIAATIFVTFLLTKLLVILWRVFGNDTIHHKFLRNVLKVILWSAGLFTALSWLPNFATAAGALIAGSGIAALTIGLAAQESLGNLFNGLFVSMFKPFEIGDRVHLVRANITGTIEDITVRHTVIRTFTNSRIIIPNSVISQELIENSHFANPQASQFIDVVISYDSDIELAMEIMMRVLGEHPEFEDTRTDEQKKTEPKVPVFVRALGLYGVELRASMWTATVLNNFAACSEVRLQLLKEFKSAGVCIVSSKLVDPGVKLMDE